MYEPKMTSRATRARANRELLAQGKRICTKCDRLLPIGAFAPDRNRHKPHCRECGGGDPRITAIRAYNKVAAASGIKRCMRCEEDRPIAEYMFPGTKDAPNCRACRCKEKREARRMNGGLLREDRRMWSTAHRIARNQANSVRRAMRDLVQVESANIRKAHLLEYYAWNSMKARCNRPTHPKYPRYGGRGIRVCDRWARSFDAFLLDVGPKPAQGLSIDRIDNDGNYEPGNVRWADDVTQQNNKSARMRCAM